MVFLMTLRHPDDDDARRKRLFHQRIVACTAELAS